MKRSRALSLVLMAPTVQPAISFAQTPTPYKIAATAPLTGPFAPSTAEYMKGAEFAVADINRAGGVKGHPLQIVVEDTQATPQGGIAALRKVVQVDGAQAVFTYFTNVITAEIPLADELKVPTIGTVETPGLYNKSEYSFSHAPTWGSTLVRMVRYWKSHGMKRIYALLTNSNDGQMKADALKTLVQGFGGSFDVSLLDADGTDFRGAIARARDTNPDVILITGQGSSTEATTVKQVREMGMKTPIWSIGQSYASNNFRDAIGPYAEGMVTGGIYLDPDAASSRPFVRRYREQLGYHPGYPAGEDYDIIKMFAYAINRVGYNGELIRGVIASLKAFPTIFGGTVSMGSDHYTQFSNAGLWQVQKGTLVRLSGT